jgi:hypothetical protein
MARRPRPTFTDQEALQFHALGKPGKLEIVPTKPMATQRDLSLAYSPGVAVPVKAIAEDPSRAYDYTTRGNLVAVISNGTAILGLGNLGALASKPVMEGKSVLFKRFADVDSIDLEIDTEDPDAFINAVRYLPSASSSRSGCASSWSSLCSMTISTARPSSPPPVCSTRSSSRAGMSNPPSWWSTARVLPALPAPSFSRPWASRPTMSRCATPRA